MSECKAVSKVAARRYRAAAKTDKMRILDELCALTSWHRDHTRKALREALGPSRPATPRKPRLPVYGEDVLVPLRKCGR